MASLKDRVTRLVATVRARRPFVDHLVRMQAQYGKTKASQQAGAVTYFGFLSFFPILALAFFVVGIVSQVYPGANANLRTAISSVLPGIIGGGPGQLQLKEFRSFSGLAGVIGLVGVLYSGLSWISALRDALTTVFETPARDQPNFVFGKLRDLLTLVLIGFILVVAVALTGFVSGFSTAVLEFLHIDSQLGWLVKLLAVAVGLAANAMLFFAMFRLLAEPHLPSRSLFSGALLGAVGFEVLKQASTFLIASTAGQPAFQAFGIALVLVVWINYFTRVVLYSAAFAHTSRAGRRRREEELLENDSAVSTPASVLASATASGSATTPPTDPDDSPSAAGAPPAAGRPGWMDDFVDKIDKAAPDEVGEASAEAARLATAAQRETERRRLVTLGAAGSAAGLVAAALLRRRRR